MVKMSIDDYQFYIAPLIDACEKKNCSEYWEFTRNLSQKQMSQEARAVVDIFDAVVSYYLVPYSPNEPLKEYIMMQGRRSPIPSDLTPEERDFLQQVLPEIKDNELKARVADTLWVLKHGKAQEHAKNAIEAYLISADTLLGESWHDTWERLARALCIFDNIRLSNKQNPTKLDAPKKISAYIENTSTPHHLIVYLVELLHETHRQNNPKHVKILEAIATTYQTESNYDSAQHVWSLAADLYKIAKNNNKAIQCQINAAETYVLLADTIQVTQNPSYIRISHFLQLAVKAYRAISSKNKRCDEIYARLVEVQSNIKNEMRLLSIPLPAPDITITKKYTQHVSEINAWDAIYKFAFIISSPNFEDIKKETEEAKEKNIFSSLFGDQLHNHNGHLITEIPTDAPIESKMHHDIALFHRNFLVENILIPVLQKIKLEHHISLFDWRDLLENCPFIPPDRINTYAYGLFHGFHGDFLSAAHILIPQIENSIRYVLTNHGIETSKQINDGTQEQGSFKELLESKELEDIFGKDLVFDLQGLLIKKEGGNLRNDLAHGLMNDAELFAPQMVYLYWLTLHIIFIPFIKSQTLDPKPQN